MSKKCREEKILLSKGEEEKEGDRLYITRELHSLW